MRKTRALQTAIEDMLNCLGHDYECSVNTCEGCKEDIAQAVFLGRDALGLEEGMAAPWEVQAETMRQETMRHLREQVQKAEQGDPPPMILQARYLIQQAERFVGEVSTSAVKTDLRLALQLIDAMIETYPELTRPG